MQYIQKGVKQEKSTTLKCVCVSVCIHTNLSTWQSSPNQFCIIAIYNVSTGIQMWPENPQGKEETKFNSRGKKIIWK